MKSRLHSFYTVNFEFIFKFSEYGFNVFTPSQSSVSAENRVREQMHVKILKLRASRVRRALLQTCFLPLSMIRLISHLFQINTKYSYIRKPSIYHLVMNVNDYIPVHCFKNEHANYRKFTNQTVYQ